MNLNPYGIYVPKEKTFFYLISGKIKLGNAVDRLRSVLTMREILTFRPPDRETPYQVMTLEEAQEAGYECKGIPLNSHVAQLAEQPEQGQRKGLWSRGG